jgi:hypothetical protein
MSGFWQAFASGAGSSAGGSLLDIINPGFYIGLGQASDRDFFMQQQAQLQRNKEGKEWELTKMLGMQEYRGKEEQRKWRSDFKRYLSQS